MKIFKIIGLSVALLLLWATWLILSIPAIVLVVVKKLFEGITYCLEAFLDFIGSHFFFHLNNCKNWTYKKIKHLVTSFSNKQL